MGGGGYKRSDAVHCAQLLWYKSWLNFIALPIEIFYWGIVLKHFTALYYQ